MGRGDHIYVNYSVYSHHGIDCGDGTVIHYRKINATISRTSWDEFANGKEVFLKEYIESDLPDVVIRRAESRLGEEVYDVGSNNCEHFATWCKTGIHLSEQVGTVAAAGSVAGVSEWIEFTPSTEAHQDERELMYLIPSEPIDLVIS